MDELESHPVPAAVRANREGWTLAVTGAVERPMSLTADDLASLPSVTHEADFECVEGWRAAGLTWRGVRVSDLLARASPTGEATHGLVRAMDGEYACSFPVDRLSSAVLAVELDGEPLPVEHGGPARLVPRGDTDCWESVKWVTEVELLASPPTADDTARELALSRAGES